MKLPQIINDSAQELQYSYMNINLKKNKHKNDSAQELQYSYININLKKTHKNKYLI